MAGQTYKNPARWFSGGATRMAWGRYTRTTFMACSPLSPVFTSNSTTCPSASVLKPSIWMAEKCTNTSSPPSCSMKPYPLASLNHFTFPLAIRSASCRVPRRAQYAARRSPGAIDLRSGRILVKEPLTAYPSIVWARVQGAIQLAVAQHGARVAARLLVGDELEKRVRIVTARPTQPAQHRRHARVVRRDCGLHAPAEAP